MTDTMSEAPPSVDTTADELADIDLKDPELSKAALKIQGKFRLKSKKSSAQESQNAEEQTQPPDTSANGDESTSSQPLTEDEKKDEDVADINLQDPELEKVALKMQSTFRKKK